MGIKCKVLTWGLRIYCLLINFVVFLCATGRSKSIYYRILKKRKKRKLHIAKKLERIEFLQNDFVQISWQ